MKRRVYTGLKNKNKHANSLPVVYGEPVMDTPEDRKQALSAKQLAKYTENKGINYAYQFGGPEGLPFQSYEFNAEWAARNQLVYSSEGTGAISPAEVVAQDPIKATATGALGVSYAYDQVGTIPIVWENDEGEEVDPPAWYLSPRIWKEHIDTFYIMASAADHGICRGEFIWYLWRDENGQVSEVMPLNTYYVQTIAKEDGTTEYILTGEDENPEIPKKQRLTSWNILHVITNPVPGYDRGVSPIQTNDHKIRGAILATLFGTKWFLQAPTPSMVLSGGQFGNDEDEEDTLETVQDQFRESGNEHSVVMVEGKDIKIEQHQVTPATSQLVETEDHNSKSLGKLTRTDPAIQGEHTGTMTKDAVIGQQQHYAASMLIPLMTKICNGLKRISPLGVTPKPDWTAILEGDEMSRHEMFRKDISAGGMSLADFATKTNQKVEWLDEDWAKEPWLPGNMVPASQLYEQAKKAAEKEEEDPTPQIMPNDPLQSRMPNSEEVEVEAGV